MRIFLIRHGESEGNVDHAAYVKHGDPHVPLTDKGWRQAAGAGAFLRHYLAERGSAPPHRIWSSPFLRTRQTLRGVLEGLGEDAYAVPPAIREDLRLAEQSYGYLPYVESQQGFFHRQVGKALAAFSRAVHAHNPFMAVTPLGESPLHAYQRIDSFVNTFYRDRERRGAAADEDVLIVSHGATIKSFMMRWFHIPLSGWPQLETPGNTDILMLEKEAGQWRITRIYDGQAGKAAHDNPLAGIERLHAGNLPPLPDFLKKQP